MKSSSEKELRFFGVLSNLPFLPFLRLFLPVWKLPPFRGIVGWFLKDLSSAGRNLCPGFLSWAEHWLLLLYWPKYEKMDLLNIHRASLSSSVPSPKSSSLSSPNLTDRHISSFSSVIQPRFDAANFPFILDSADPPNTYLYSTTSSINQPLNAYLPAFFKYLKSQNSNASPSQFHSSTHFSWGYTKT